MGPSGGITLTMLKEHGHMPNAILKVGKPKFDENQSPESIYNVQVLSWALSMHFVLPTLVG